MCFMCAAWIVSKRKEIMFRKGEEVYVDQIRLEEYCSMRSMLYELMNAFFFFF